MSLLHPWALMFGGLAVGLPVLIHWLTKPRPVRYPLSTVRFVLEAVHQRAARHRLRDFLILLLRAAAVALIAWAFARPLVGGGALVTAGGATDAARVVILDVSQSMAARSRGIELFERARSQAADFLGYRSRLRANLILAGARPRPVFERPSTNFAALQEELSKSKVLPQRLDINAAIASAAEMLAAVPGDADVRRELVVVSDFQRDNWASADFSALPQGTLIQLESVSPREPLENVGLLRVAAAGRIELGRKVRIEAEVGNYSAAARRVEVQIDIGGATLRLEGLCPPRVKSTLSTELTMDDAGWQVGQARLLNIEDALSADDARPFVLEVRPATTHALITRQRSRNEPNSSYFLERALAPFSDQARMRQRVYRIDPGRIDRETLAPADVIVLDRPGKLPDESIRLLTSLLQRGRPLFYVASEPVDAINLRLLADAAGTSLQMPVEFVPPAVGQVRRELFLTDVRRSAQPFAVFGDELTGLIGSLRFAGGLSSRRLDGGLSDDVLATFSDQSACLVVTGCGSGTLAVLNADLARSNLVSSTLFVPLLAELTDRLLGETRATGSIASGEPLVRYLPISEGGLTNLEIVPPDGAGAELGELVEESAAVLWRWPAAGLPGVYQVRRGETIFAIASTIHPQESDLRTLAAETLEGRLAGGREVAFRAAEHEEERRDDRWTWFAVACLGCVIVELVTLRIFRT